MRKSDFRLVSVVFLALLCLASAARRASAQAAKTAYPAMAPIDAYMIADQNAEIALARSGAPPSIAKDAEVMVLGKNGFTTAAKGTNGFLCLVERYWGDATDDAEFWNPKVRSPICFNQAAAESFAPIFLMKTKLVLAGKSKSEILAATDAAFDNKKLPALKPGAMCYMMSKQQYLNDRGMSWHPHVMVFASGDVTKTWGADQSDSPVIAANDPEERVTIFMFWVGNWSDGSTAPSMTQ